MGKLNFVLPTEWKKALKVCTACACVCVYEAAQELKLKSCQLTLALTLSAYLPLFLSIFPSLSVFFSLVIAT